MDEPIIPPPAKLFAAIRCLDIEKRMQAERLLKKRFGDADYRTKEIPIPIDLYEQGNRPILTMVLISYKKLITREDIVKVKQITHEIEKKVCKANEMNFSVDPGYLTLSNVYLASFKEFFHRTYVRKGVYLENLYRYLAKRYQPWEWTPPEYRKPEALFFFHEMRRLYCNQTS